MLRASAHATSQPVELRAITEHARDPLLPAGRELLAFTSALIGDGDQLDAARDALRAAVGDAGVVRAAAVAGNFQMMNRLVDATGVPLGASMRAFAAELGIDPPPLR